MKRIPVDFRPLKPSPELEKLHKQVEEATRAFSEQVNKAKSKWLSGWLKKLIPPKIYNMGKSGTKEQQAEVAKYLEEHGIRMAFHQNGDTDLIVNNKIVSRLVVRWQDGNALVASKDFPESLQ